MSDETAIMMTHEARGEIAKRIERPPVSFTEEQMQMVANTYALGATQAELQVFLEICRSRRLSPFKGQVHYVARWTKDPDNPQGPKIKKWAIQVSIDGFRGIADETGLYDGQDEPDFEYPKSKDGTPNTSAPPLFVRVRVYRKGISRPFVGIAHMSEFKQDNHMWGGKPHTMLAKCAEAQGLRKAFPQELGDLYEPEEMGRDETHVERAQELVGAGVTKLADKAAQPALPAKTDAPQEDWAALLAGTKTSAETLAVGNRMDKALAPGTPQRKVLSEIYKVRIGEQKKAETAAKKSETPPCEVCGLVGAHASECVNAPSAEQPPEAT